jgi:Fe-S-cluster containining protein
MKLETDLTKIKKLANEKEDENWAFRSFLKRCDLPSKEIDTIVHDLYLNVSSEIDCTRCANCCKVIGPSLNERDIRAFARHLGMSVDRFKATHLIEGESSQQFILNKLPCPFLEGNLCSNYDHRPEDCRSFPHLHKKRFTSRLIAVVENCSI